jgi:hypothetical protein
MDDDRDQTEVTIEINDEEIEVTRDDAVEAFERTTRPFDSYSRRVHYDGEKKGLKDVFRNISNIPDNARTHADTIRRRFRNLGFEVSTEDTNPQSEASTSISPDTDVYIQRGSDGPYRQNLGTSLTTPLTADLRAELQDLIAGKNVDDPAIQRLYELLDNENVTAWGTRSDHDVVRSMDSGDQVVYVERGADRSKPYVRYRQQIDLAVSDPGADGDRFEIQSELAERIWRDDGFTSLWFSTTDLTYYENPSDEPGYEVFEEVIQQVDSEFRYYKPEHPSEHPWWFTKDSTGSSLIHVDEQYVDHYGGASGFLEALRETEYVRLAEEPAPTYLVIDADEIRERDFRPVVHEYDGYDADPKDATQDPRVKYVAQFADTAGKGDELLVEADVRGYVLIRDGGQFVARAKLGCAFGKRVDDDFAPGRSGRTLKIAALVDYREFQSPIDQSTVDQRVGIGSLRSAAVTEIHKKTYTGILNAVIGLQLPERINRLAQATTLQDELLWVAAAHLVAGKNVVFYGPPGTGKTYTARRLTERGFDADIEITTAHAELTNYDLVGGYAPGTPDHGTSDGNDISWRPSPGILTKTVETCINELQSHTGHAWLLVDELNRANLDQAFGDIFTLLDQDYRDTQFLEYADESRQMPYSFRLVATMNTSDRAKLFSLGYAFRRRFGFVPTPSLFADGVDVSAYDPVTAPDQAVPNRSELRSMIGDAVQDSLTTSRLLLDSHQPVVYPRDAVPIDPMFARQSRIDEAYGAITSPETFGYTDTDGVDLALELGRYIDSETDVDIGHTLMIDVTQFLVAADLITDGDLDRSWLDWGITTQLLPQLDEFLGELREEQTIGSVTDGTKDPDQKPPTKRFEDLLDRLDECGLPRSRATLEAAADGYQLI